MCSTCYSYFRDHILLNKPAKHSKLTNCICGKLTKHFAFGMCESCYGKMKAKDYHKNVRKNSPELMFKEKIRDNSRKVKPALFSKYNCCKNCGSKEKLQIHHINYTTELKDMTVLCRTCHIRLHKEKIKTVVI